MNSDPWSTFSEIKWIETLGRHHDHWNKPSYADLLRNYLSAAKKRRNWDRIDKKTVIGYAKDRLREVTKNPTTAGTGPG